jgi:hypothetical protein
MIKELAAGTETSSVPVITKVDLDTLEADHKRHFNLVKLVADQLTRDFLFFMHFV